MKRDDGAEPFSVEGYEEVARSSAEPGLTEALLAAARLALLSNRSVPIRYRGELAFSLIAYKAPEKVRAELLEAATIAQVSS